MIKYLLNSDIDFDKYDACILGAKNSLIYANSWYLDCVTVTWDILVLNDYEAVMPLPKKSKFFIHYIYQPAWVQQLGVFSKIDLNENIMKSFLDALSSKFLKVDTTLNYFNLIDTRYISQRNNYMLNLDKTYQDLYDKYENSRKKSVIRAHKLNLTIDSNDSMNALVQLFKNNIGKDLKKSTTDYRSLEKLVQICRKKNISKIFEVRGENRELLGGAIFLFHDNRIIYLFSAVSQKGKQCQAISYLLDFIIKEYANRAMILDFEGSSISGIANFFKSFGSYNQPYFWFNKGLI